MTTILFVRHGETAWNREGRFQGTRDIPLNEEGRHQARRLAASWARGGDVLVSSPLARAKETAQILGTALKMPLQGVDPLLVERCYGQGEGLTLAERLARFPDHVVPGLETQESIRTRVRAFLNSVSQSHPGRRVIAVSHGGFINAALWIVSKGEVGTGKTFLENASVTTLVRDARGWRVLELGRSAEVVPLV